MMLKVKNKIFLLVLESFSFYNISKVPIVYKSGAELIIIIEFNDGGTKNLKGKESDCKPNCFQKIR